MVDIKRVRAIDIERAEDVDIEKAETIDIERAERYLSYIEVMRLVLFRSNSLSFCQLPFVLIG